MLVDLKNQAEEMQTPSSRTERLSLTWLKNEKN